ncbi:MAG: hypothetical protein LUH15_04465, partial [Tannerellaceae bacterium]|nr:hypothetical protein [Tannerellaceae bacterium]
LGCRTIYDSPSTSHWYLCKGTDLNLRQQSQQRPAKQGKNRNALDHQDSGEPGYSICNTEKPDFADFRFS